MTVNYNKKIILENGQEYYGFGFGYDEDKVCEIVFNTSMAGYQEILSDPSYTNQAVVMTYPLIGNYGMADDDYETETPTIGAMIVREYNDVPSNFRSTKTLAMVMKEFSIPGVYGVDTRKLTRAIRDFGSSKALITKASTPLDVGLEILRVSVLPTDAVEQVSCQCMWRYNVKNPKFHVVAIDCGIKMNIIRELNKFGCQVTRVPWNTSVEVIERIAPDGIFLSNGPGNPEDVQELIENIRKLLGKYPIFGICLGHQLLALAYGGQTYKLKFGHRGGNHPVRNLLNNKIEITSQNHSYAVEPESIKATPLEITHLNILDDTVEGMRCVKDKVFSVQYHPESAPGPQDGKYLFKQFVDLMEEAKEHA
ncbi:MAG: glutamine-hydrolyzing carbamoyl-phosphate synthase small subunit [Phascolarctobacterium sp.]|nr:glutamine-hydrolyzing carbamoyl-phosphate synthase small subunit [Phascolarctobacterium sp.]MBR1975766.1 glutamine-hydrolyzing carbamoyl-phosphate synthase small subunit [Phascolarctobacterium sp.]MBR2140044.1 glutamine-hydrolyzing carbamoyl-phosphate synthase small subunit [Phascolarctobacterium sp.]MBR6679375.1 glutamine-hydrolyzing carbamoyl-phosphate synthase small subunit [Phascolarctobacterium sp.]MDO5473918.1 glutamine-hydrolyzing carbamoyl-phosphate synthase small subunit [Phascolarc